MRWLHVYIGLATLGCAQPADAPSFVAPLDGQSGVALNAPLQVHLGAARYPVESALPPSLVTVVDVGTGAEVEGQLRRGEWPDVLFVPDGGWAADGRYVWSVRQPTPLARQPELQVPSGLVGEARFTTAALPELLDAVVTDGGRLCLLLSGDAAAAELPDSLLLNDQDWPIEGAEWVRPQLDDPALTLLEADDGVVAACLDAPVDAGDVVRLELDSDTWQVQVTDLDLLDIVRQRHRRHP